MNETILPESGFNSQNAMQEINSENIIPVDLEVTETDEIQKEKSVNKDGNQEGNNIKENDVRLTIEEDFLKSYIYIQNEIPIERRQFWVQYVGTRVEPMGDSLEYQPETRNTFILLVFTIVLIMLLFTAGFVACVLFIPVLDDFFGMFGLFLFIPAMIILVGMSYAFSCSSCTRVPPCNFICLVIVTLCMSIITAYISRRYSIESIFYAIIATALVVMVCMCLACTRFDFTKYMLYVIVIGAALGAIALVVMLGMLITGHYLKPVHLAILVVLTLVQAILLTIELQTILGGRTVELGEDDYAVGAYMLYTSIINIFIMMVQMIGMFE